jgi:hypothetical protein
MSLEMAKSVSFGRPFGLYRGSPPNRAVGLSACCHRECTGQTPQGTGQLSGARWPSACTSFERQPFTLNGCEPLPSRYARTGHFTVHGSGTGQMSGASPPRALSSTESTRPPDRRAPDKRPVRCSVRCVRLSAKPLGLATGQSDVAPGMSGAFLAPLSGASHRSVSLTREHLLTGQEPPDKTSLSGALSGAPQSTLLSSFLHPCLPPPTPKCSITLCTCVSVFTSILSRVLVSH